MNTKNILKTLFLLCGLCPFLSCITEEDTPTERIGVGDHLPAFTVVMSNGEVYDSEAEGRSLIVFFHTSCADCRRELPRLNEQYQAGEYDGFRVVCISREEEARSIETFWQANALTLPYSAQPDRRIYSLFASSGIPRIYETDAHGIVVRVTK